jgi:hypothetical protein
MSPQDFADKATDKEVLDTERALTEFLAGQSLNFCAPGISCAIVFPVGPMGQAAASEGVTFGHGARHLVGTGLAQGEVEAAIAQDVKAAVANAAEKGGFWGRVVVKGQVIEYRAFPLPNGTVNVGTYYKP